MEDLIAQKEKELALLKEQKKEQAIKDQRKAESYKKFKAEVDELESVLGQKMILHCPFCGGKGELTGEYYSNDSMPDGHYNYCECADCSAQGKSFYSVSISESNLTQEQFIVQEKHRLEAMIGSIDAWNERV